MEEDDEEDDEEEGGNHCSLCDQTKIVHRKPRDMRAHYGLIASGNQVIKDAAVRDEINTKLGGQVLCFEMEAAGLMNDFPCIVIRGICDYADSHKNKDWQEHAAAVAAAFAKELLSWVPVQEVEQMPTIKILRGIESQLERLSNTAGELRSRQQNQEYQETVDWLTPANYASQQNDFISRRQQGTGKWLLESNKFQQWLSQSNQTLFCPGIPGAGKTILTSIVISYLHNKFRGDATIGIAYIFCNFRQQHEQKHADLTLSLLKQLVQQRPFIPEIVKDLYNLHEPKQTRPSPDELLNILQHVTAFYSRTFIIIDALDECQVSHEGRETFLREIFNLQAKGRVNIFATSRFIQEIEAKFNQSIRLEIRASGTDIQEYLDRKLQNFPSWVLKDDSLQREIKSKIAKAADGMFLLAQLYMDSLAYETTPKAIRLALSELGKTSEVKNNNKKSKALDSAYLEAIKQIQAQNPKHRELAMHALSWITCAKRRLTSAELQHAIAVEVKESQLDRDNIADIGLIISVCAGLVIVDKESDIIRLVHYTTQEFFERTWKDWFPDAHSDITKICVTYLSFGVFETGYSPTKDALTERLKSNILYNYAARNWGYHAGQSLIEGERLISDLLKSTLKVSACSQAMIYDGYGSYIRETKMMGIHLAAYFGLCRSISYLLGGLRDIDPKDYSGQTLLSRAAENGHELVVKLLLENNTDIKSKNNEYS